MPHVVIMISPHIFQGSGTMPHVVIMMFATYFPRFRDNATCCYYDVRRIFSKVQGQCHMLLL